MATHQSISGPARSQHSPTPLKAGAITPTSAVDPLDMPLLNAGFAAEDMFSLPFVRRVATDERAAHVERYGSGHSFWSVPPSTGYTRDCEVGRAFGAAYLIHLSAAQGNALPLGWIVLQMSDDKPHGFQVGFLSAVELYARSLAVNVGRARIESDFRERMARGRALLANPRKQA